MTDFKLHNLDVKIIQKNIKHVYLSVCPPMGHVKVSAPAGMSLDTIRVYVISKLNWIKKQQAKFKTKVREAFRECLDREGHYFNGQHFLLQVVECDAAPRVEVSHSHIVLYIRKGTPEAKKRALLEAWYRQQLSEKINVLIPLWEKKMGVAVSRCTIRKMKTKWGSCTPKTRAIRLNLELVKKPPECLEYVVVHELAHLLEPSHNRRFITLMDEFLPSWRVYRESLNALPVRQ